MRSAAPALAPLFRSGEQLRILARLFAGPGGELSIGQLADETSVAISTASREISRLEQHGLVRTRQLGRFRLVEANWELPWAEELRALLTKTVGVLGVLSEQLAGLDGIERCWVYGSWADRYLGAPGPFPRDVDVLIVGDADRRQLNTACRKAEARVGSLVNPVVAAPEEWRRPKRGSFFAQVKAGPLVEVPLG